MKTIAQRLELITKEIFSAGGNVWWLMRHAPVVGVDGIIYGASDVDCDCSELDEFAAIKRALPKIDKSIVTDLSRTQRTFAALKESFARDDCAADLAAPVIEGNFREQSLGAWEGLSHDMIAKKSNGEVKSFWQLPAHLAPPEGESFIGVAGRTTKAFARHDSASSASNILLVAHAGSIRSILSGGFKWPPEHVMKLHLNTLSLTVVASDGKGNMRRLMGVNLCWDQI